MQYFGGKARVGPRIVVELERVRNGRPFVEPFCGGLWITHRMAGERYASDLCRPLITLYEALQDGWDPPSVVTEETYHRIKQVQDPFDPMTAFVGFGCSFAGKFFGGYARNLSVRNYAATARSSLLRKMKTCQDVRFSCVDYRKIAPRGTLVYLDPPYLNCTPAGGLNSIDTEELWAVVRSWSDRNLVVVSEYVAPPDFLELAAFPTTTRIRNARNEQEPRLEKLFVHASLAREVNL